MTKSIPELQLILFFLSRSHCFKDPAPFRGNPAGFENIDWNLFVDLSRQHKVLPMVYQSIVENTEINIPEDVRARMKSTNRSIVIRNLSISSKLVHILKMLGKNHIACIPFKGPVLSKFAYNDSALRQFSDIDLFISRKDVSESIRLFKSQGYELQIALKPSQFETYAKIKESIELRHKDRSMLIDLHWEFTGNYSIQPFALEFVRDRLVEIDFLNQKILHLSKTDLIACLCLHGAKNYWDSLESVFCVSLLLQNLSPSEEASLCEISSAKKCKKTIALGMNLCVHFFNTSLSEKMRHHFFIFPDLDKVSRPIIQYLSVNKSRQEDRSNRFSRFNLTVRDSFFDKIRYALRMLFLPSFVDWHQFSFSNRLSILYFVIRPVRLVTTYLKNFKT